MMLTPRAQRPSGRKLACTVMLEAGAMTERAGERPSPVHVLETMRCFVQAGSDYEATLGNDDNAYECFNTAVQVSPRHTHAALVPGPRVCTHTAQAWRRRYSRRSAATTCCHTTCQEPRRMHMLNLRGRRTVEPQGLCGTERVGHKQPL